MTTESETLKKAMDLLDRAADHLADSPAPDATWWKELFQITGEHMILTEEGWESGEGKSAYLTEGDDNPILDEVNAPL